MSQANGILSGFTGLLGSAALIAGAALAAPILLPATGGTIIAAAAGAGALGLVATSPGIVGNFLSGKIGDGIWGLAKGILVGAAAGATMFLTGGMGLPVALAAAGAVGGLTKSVLSGQFNANTIINTGLGAAIGFGLGTVLPGIDLSTVFGEVMGIGIGETLQSGINQVAQFGQTVAGYIPGLGS